MTRMECALREPRLAWRMAATKSSARGRARCCVECDALVRSASSRKAEAQETEAEQRERAGLGDCGDRHAPRNDVSSDLIRGETAVTLKAAGVQRYRSDRSIQRRREHQSNVAPPVLVHEGNGFSDDHFSDKTTALVVCERIENRTRSDRIKAAAAVWITGAIGLACATSYWWLGLTVGVLTVLIMFVADSFPDPVRKLKQEPTSTDLQGR